MSVKRILVDRNGAVSVLFAAAAVPMIGLVGLAVDYGIWNQTNATLSVAANVAAMTAVKIAANEQLAGNQQYLTDGKKAGLTWFKSEVGYNTQIGTKGVILDGANANVVVNNPNGDSTVQALVSYSGQVPSVFGLLFGKSSYGISGQAVAQVASAPYLNIEILLDNSGSMEIGALNSDIIHLQQITPCNQAQLTQNAPGALYNGNGNLAKQDYSAFSTGGYTGSITVPFPAPPQLKFKTFPSDTAVDSSGKPLTCEGLLAKDPKTGNFPTPGPPCAFACHWDTSGKNGAGSGNDFYALARSTIGTANPITLRFDLVKAATNEVVSTMQSDNIASINNLQVGIFTFTDTLARVYPDPNCGTAQSCQSGNAWATAIADVGSPPTFANGPDSGIQPYTGGNGANTDFHGTMTDLATNYLTQSGDGTKATTPRKVLFLVSDGLDDANGNGRRGGGVQAADCNLFKDMGYTIYVVYTPYYQLMNPFYQQHVKTYAEPTATGALATSLQSCSSDSVNDYVSASDGPGLAAALQKFLKAALSTPARFTM